MTKKQKMALDEIMNADALNGMKMFNGNLVVRTNGKRTFFTIESIESAIKTMSEKSGKELRPRIIDLVNFCDKHGEEDPKGDTGGSFTFVARNLTEEQAYED
jgi:hypothetical protein